MIGTTPTTTKIGTMAKQGDILLIPVPFNDLSSQKRRPVIVISNNAYNRKTGDIVVVAMTSNPATVDFSFAITSSDLKKGILNRPWQSPSRQGLRLISDDHCQNVWANQ